MNINTETQIIGIIGHPLTQTKSPQMHNTMFKRLGLNYVYLPFCVKENELDHAIKGFRALNISGFNVTIPYKVKIIEYLDELSEEAQAIGAVNTVVNKNGKLIGYNTDGEGYIRSLTEETNSEIKGKSVLILGAGGAAKAIGYSLTQYFINKLVIVNRDREKAIQLASHLPQNVQIITISYEQIKDYIDKIDIIINTTSVGMYPNIGQTLIKKDLIKSNQIVSDIIYNPIQTQLIKDAINQGAIVHNGLGMFIYQGALAFEKWTKIKPDPLIMKQAVESTGKY